jgi:hypothetical protein
MKYIIILFFVFVCQQSFSQALSMKDFKISLDNFVLSDSSNTIRMTKEELLKTRQLHTNFVWSHIKSFMVYFGGAGTDVISSSCNGDTMYPDLKKYFDRVQSGTVIVIDPTVVNMQGKQVDWNGLTILIK